MSRWLKITLKITAVIVVLLILIPVGIMLYITYNKTKILSLVNVELNKDLDGKMTIGDMRPQLFNHFPNISLELRDVLVRDNHFAQHHHTLLDAKNFYISVNTAALLTGTVNVREINIDNAAIDLFTDSTGYSNTSVFKTKSKKKKGLSLIHICKDVAEVLVGVVGVISVFEQEYQVNAAKNNARSSFLFMGLKS